MHLYPRRKPFMTPSWQTRQRFQTCLATFTFVDTGIGTLTGGTVFTVIDNTSASPIAGTFSNLPDGSTFTSNGNNFKVSYTGGTGNDLTLKVVP